MDLYSPSGQRYRTEIPTEITRLRSSGYTDGPERPATVTDLQYHPADHPYQEVLDYMAEHPEESDRIVAEEKAGKNRVSITGEKGTL